MKYVIREMKTSALLELYNKIAGENDLPTVKRFSDRKAAERRVTKILQEHGEGKATAEKKTRSTKRVGFNFPPKYDVPRKVREDSLRERAINQMKKGATIEQLQELCSDWHEEHGEKPRNVERRTYELIRLINHYVGYGVREVKGKIFVYTKQIEADV